MRTLIHAVRSALPVLGAVGMLLWSAGSALVPLAVRTPDPAALDRAVEQITADLDRLTADGVRVHLVGVDGAASRVEVGVDAASLDTARTLLPERYRGVPLHVAAHAPLRPFSREDSPGLFKAGLNIGCTSGFTVRRPLDGRFYALTAGHCQANGNEVRHAGMRVGVVMARQFHGDIDAAAFRLESGLASGFVFRSDDWLEPVVTFGTANAGDPVCMSGATSGTRCGRVVTTNTTLRYDSRGVTLVNMHCTDIPGGDGDSGAPVYHNGVGYGIVSGGNNNGLACYTPIERITRAFGLAALGTIHQPKVLMVRHSGLYLDADIAGGTGNGTRVQQWSYNGWSNQTFSIRPVMLAPNRFSESYRIYAWHNGRAVSFESGFLSLRYNGGQVMQWDEQPNDYLWQQFQFVRGPGDSFSLRSRYNGRCLDIDIAYAPYANGTKAQQWDCNGWDNQRFTLYDR